MRQTIAFSATTLLVASCAGLVTGCGGTPPAQSPGPETESVESAEPSEKDAASGSAVPSSAEDNPPEFQLNDSDTASSAHGASASKIQPTNTEAAMKFFVVDKNKGPMKGVVIIMTSPAGKKFYTEETDDVGYAEVLVPVGQNYALTYLSLGRRDIKASVPVSDEPRQNIKLTLRYEDRTPPKKTKNGYPRGILLGGITFDTGKANILPESYPQLDAVYEFMLHKKSAKVEISGHTDNVGLPANNQKLSERRAQACRDYLINKGIDGSRIIAVGFGDQRPVASNDTEEGRQKNRRIEAMEL